MAAGAPGDMPVESRGAGRVIAVCAVASFADGYDIQALGLAIPRMAMEFHLPPASFAAAASTSLVGMALGAMLLSPFADRHGHERTLAAMLGLIAVTTFALLFTPSPFFLAIFRLISGLGLGAAVPVAIALTSARVRSKHRTALITFMVCFTGVGAFAAGQIAPLLDAGQGWRAIFGLGALLPLVGSVLAWLIAPSREKRPVRRGVEAALPPRAPSIRALFAPSLRLLTFLVWALFWLNLMVNYSLISWLPTLLGDAGWDMGSAARATGLMSIGGIVGGLAISVLADRGRGLAALLGVYFLAAVAMAMFGFTPAGHGVWIALILLVGTTAFGAQLALSAIIAAYYPLAIRSTAIGGWSGFGRWGAFVGPLALASLMTAGTPPHLILAILMVPMLLCLGCVAALPRAVRKAA